MEDDVEAFIRAGVDGVLVKPLLTEQLDKIIEYIQKNGNKRILPPRRASTPNLILNFLTGRHPSSS